MSEISRFSIHDEDKLRALLIEHKQQPYRYDQIIRSVYKDLYDDFDDFTTISKELRELLKKHCFFYSLTVDSEHTSKNGQTTKFILKTHDEKMLECVIMRHLTGRITLCVSSQVGCPMACTFCATGKLGMIRNLESFEIIEQFMIAQKHLQKEGTTLRNAVYMGMGEPFLNYENVKQSIEIVIAQKKIDLSNRRVTVSTCGIVPGIRKFTQDFPQNGLAISLHCPVDDVRLQIMPVNHTYPIAELMKSLDEHVEATNNRIFYEYIMIRGVTDKLEYAHKLGELLS